MVEPHSLLRELIALPSVNPAFLPAGDPHAGEHRVAEFVGATAARSGIDVEFRPVFKKRSNIMARISPSGKIRHRLVLAPHLDTVNCTAAQFQPVERKGRLYGRGACDAKGSVAAMLAALCEVGRGGKRPTKTEILFAGLVDEEDNQAGSRALAESGCKADLAIVGEPTSLQLVTAHKGTIWLRLETAGKSAHGARPELGHNAVHTMAQIVHLLETEYALQLTRRRHALLGSATVSVGVISGGIQPNIVPDRCTILVDRRTLPGETEVSVCREILTLLHRHGMVASCGDDKHARCLPLETDPQLPFVAQMLKQLQQREPTGVDYFCDAAILARGGIPSVVFGPGDIAYAHTEDEWIPLKELARAKAILVQFLRSLP
jgi:acetylornithine deacetylase